MKFVVAMDGPAGSGKGTIAKGVAEKLNLVHIDTGAMYRSIALYTIKNGIEKNDSKTIIDSVENLEIEFKTEEGKQLVFLNGEDVTNKIRLEDVNSIVSDIASIHEVREKMVLLQRKLSENKRVIMEGRDIGTVVFPDADIKIYLDADLDVRAERRYKEYIEKGIQTTFEEVKDSIIQRDIKDKTRKYGALKMAEDAIRVDTTNLNIDQVIDEVVKIVKQREGGEI